MTAGKKLKTAMLPTTKAAPVRPQKSGKTATALPIGWGRGSSSGGSVGGGMKKSSKRKMY